MASQQSPVSRSETLTFGLLPCISDRHVHAVVDPADDYPEAVCGWNLVPDVYLEGDVLLCRRGCRAGLPDDAELPPACDERRRSVDPGHAGPLVRLERRRLARKFDRRIQRTLDVEWRRG